MTPEDLLNTLEDLGDEEFSKFKWFLQQPDSLQGFLSIRKRDLETADRLKTVDLMVQTYRLPGAVEVIRKILEKINRNDLVQSLSDSSSGPEGQSHKRKTGCGSSLTNELNTATVFIKCSFCQFD